jgi:hypothetical protein
MLERGISKNTIIIHRKLSSTSLWIRVDANVPRCNDDPRTLQRVDCRAEQALLSPATIDLQSNAKIITQI